MKNLVFMPFERYSEKLLTGVGFLVLLLTTVLADVYNLRFDGVLDAHYGQSVSLEQVAFDQLINVLSLILLFYLSAKYINRKARMIDIVSTVLVGRIPFVLLPLLNFNQIMFTTADAMVGSLSNGTQATLSFLDASVIIIFSIIMLLTIVWAIALWYNGFKVASNARGKLSVVLFILSLLIAEVLSKILITQFNI